MSGGSNFMYDVMTNGIGGVNVGGLENDISPWRGSRDVIDEINIFRYLVRDRRMAELYHKEGYLKLVNDTGHVANKYRITQKGKDAYRGSAIIDKWIANNEKILVLKGKYNRIKNGLTEKEKAHFLNEIDDLVKRVNYA